MLHVSFGHTQLLVTSGRPYHTMSMFPELLHGIMLGLAVYTGSAQHSCYIGLGEAASYLPPATRLWKLISSTLGTQLWPTDWSDTKWLPEQSARKGQNILFS